MRFMTVQPNSVAAHSQNPLIPERPALCLPQFIYDALENIRAFFSKIETSTWVGFTAILISGFFFEVHITLIATAILGIYKISQNRLRELPNRIPESNAERLPEGTVRSRYTQRTILNHNYREEDLFQEVEEVSAALRAPLPNGHNQTCCAITATLLDYFYAHGFEQLTPIRLDALLARGIQMDVLARRQTGIGLDRIDIDEFFQGLGDRLEHIHFNPGDLPIQAPLFQGLIQQLLARTERGPIAGCIWSNHHFTGLYIQRDQDGQISQIYVSESRGVFNVGARGSGRVESGQNRGAVVVPIGNTIEQAAIHLNNFYGNAAGITLYPIYPR